ncbi:MAG TPA: hypothetical protein VGB63_11320 [Pedobacter sp.]|jgi:hypothetical protein
MKRRKILSIAIVPVIVITMAAFTNLQPGKDKKDDKGKKSQEHGKAQSDDKPDHQKENGNDKDNHKVKENHQQGNKEGLGNKHVDKRNNKNDDGYKKSDHGNGNSHKMNGKRDRDIDWNLNDFANRKHPKDQKKVTICHKPSTDGTDNGVTISVSENALKAHMNHGDESGECKNNNSGRWSDSYVKSRENVYNTYEQSWERMSYGEALVRIAASKLLGLKSNLDQNRSMLSAQEIQRRETLISDLETNTKSVNTQLGVTRQKLDSDVNIIIKL